MPLLYHIGLALALALKIRVSNLCASCSKVGMFDSLYKVAVNIKQI